MNRRSAVLLLALVPLAVAGLGGAHGSTGAREGGIFRVTFLTGSGNFDNVDPALAYSRESWALLDTVCARLMRYRDRPPPEGYRIVPEVAARLPTKVSPDGKTTTFKLRSGFRFSDGRPVDAEAFAHAIHRTMAPGVDSPGYRYTQFHRRRRGRPRRQGAARIRRDRARNIAHHPVHARGPRVRRVDDDAVLLRGPADASARSARASGSSREPGPTTIHEYRPNERVVIRRNRHYGGNRAAPRRRLPRRPQRRARRTRRSNASTPAAPTGPTRFRRVALQPHPRADPSTASTTRGSSSPRG